MKTLLPSWPRSIPRVFTPLARFTGPRMSPTQYMDALSLQNARQRRREQEEMSNLSGRWTDLIWCNTSDFAAFNTSASEGSILTPGPKEQPTLGANFFYGANVGYGRAFGLLLRGIIGTTSTPTIVFQIRASTTQGAATLSGTSLGVSAAITTGSGVSNKWWELRLDMICTVLGQGTNNCTLAGAGYVSSPGGFASPFVYPLEPTTPDTGTWSATIDSALTQYLNASVTWGTSSSSNTITTKQAFLYGYN